MSRRTLTFTLLFFGLVFAGPQVAFARANRSREVELRGTLLVSHSDDFRHGRARWYYALWSRGHRTVLHFRGAGPRLRGGTRVVVRGLRTGRSLVVTHRVRPLPAHRQGASGFRLAAAAPRKVAVILFNFTNNTSQPWTPDYVRSVMFTANDSVSAYYDEESYGRVSFTGKTRSDGDVLGWYSIGLDDSGCKVDAWAQAARSAAQAAGVNLTGYDHLVYAFPDVSSCGWAGLAETPGSQVWISGYFTRPVVGHELGHNLGVHHASSLACTDGTGQRVPISSNCTRSEYGDPFDVMGSGSRQTSNFHKGQYGWFDPANMRTVTGSGAYSIAPLETPSAGLQLLRIPRGATGEYYYLEFRQAYGLFDNFAPTDPAVTGVTIRLCPDYPYIVQTKLIDTTPSTMSFADAPLGAGRTFTDPDYNISVKTTTVDSAGATVEVTLGGGPPPASDSTPPSAPGPLNGQAIQGGSVALSWAAATDNVGVTGYRVYRNGVQIGNTAGTAYSDAGAAGGTTYTYYVRAYDAAGNLGGASNTITVTTPTPGDTTPPSAPGTLSAQVSGGTVTLVWGAASDNAAVAGYRVYRDGLYVATTSALTYSDGSLISGATYSYSVRAEDANGNLGPGSNAVSVTVPSSVTPAGGPSTPTSAGQAPETELAKLSIFGRNVIARLKARGRAFRLLARAVHLRLRP